MLPTLVRGTDAHAQVDIRDEVFYQFMPIAWRDSDNDAVRFGDFGGMTASLDYLEDLGITAVWMNPIFPSPAYHGYQHGRADEFNSRFGNESEWIAFLEAAHARGIKVFVDFVAYGISQDSPWFESAYGNPASEYDDWLAFTNGANTEYLGSVYSTWNGDTVGFIHWDLRHPGPVGLVTSWAQRLLDPDMNGDFSDGLDGFRLDHVWQTYPNGPDGWGYHIDTFWAPWRSALRSVNPDVFIFAEQADWGSYGTELFQGMDAAFTKPFEFAARDALRFEDASGLYSAMDNTLRALEAAPNPGTLLCIIGDHDVDRLASSIGTSFEKGKTAAAVLLAQPLPPVIYYGDEIGMRGTKNTGYSGDAADIPMREPFKWNQVAGPPMSNYFLLNNAAYNGRISRDNDGRSVEEQSGVSGSLLEAYRDLIAVRRANTALSRGTYHAAASTSSQVWSFLRYDEGSSSAVLVVINVSGSTQTLDLDLADFEVTGGTTTPTDLLTGASLTPISTSNQDAYPVTLSAYEYQLLDVELVPPPPPVSLVDGVDIPADFGTEALLTTQDSGTSFGDDTSELDQLYLRSQHDSLFIGLTGNLEQDGTGLVLCFDTEVGGQNILDLSNIDPPPSGPRELTGLRFDNGFAPDLLYFVNSFGSTFWVDRFSLRTSGGADRVYRGSGTVNLPSGFLGGGNNSAGMQIAFNDTNTLGVTESDPSPASTATSGFELYLPYDELGLSGTETAFVGISAFLVRGNGSVGNQWLPGVGTGVGELGFSPDMTQVPGDQYLFVTLDPESTGTGEIVPADRNTQLHLVGDSPTADGARLAFVLDEATDVDLSIHDIQGRRVRQVASGAMTAGRHEVVWEGDLDSGARAPSGIYFARLSWSYRAQHARIVLLN
ncbi:MAG: alpha-glucosidase C-terminal domain-containing protein [Candidatus Eisenbacteria bacterium]|uniref:Alpha-glucosidase C-terminal domain-containing protein n=1 Tax=Eiseniibacteriota bacterium TaxID=2212470 RepID=A0A956ND68_UNCEI|nr:alpha-glucosidase C-terminal domain-containing protein [Candidatus Eisenbacteria bacterium]